MYPTWDKRIKQEVGRLLRWIGGRLDTLAALLIGAGAAISVVTGSVEDPEDLAAITLGVLTVVAFSLIVERSLRFKSSKELSEVRGEVSKIHEALQVFDSGSPYHVVDSESTWDIQDDGSASVVRRKRLRFSQEDVVTVIDWVKGDGEIQDIRYRPSANESPIHSYVSDGRTFSLIALDRPYGRGEELDFIIEREMKGCFVKTPDRISVVPLESTSLLTMRVRWPKNRTPRAVRFTRRTDTQRQKPSSLSITPGEDGRAESFVEVQRPERGERLCVEWDWDPPSAPTEATSNGATATEA